MSAPAPGPWTFEGITHIGGEEGFGFIADRDGNRIADFSGAVKMANVRPMVAAPDMLAALKEVEAAFLAQPEGIRTENVCLIGKMDQILAAIAKAGGAS